jgi:hypothetical protein
MITKNPFPGMNPFFEQTWRDAHARLIAYICDDLQPRLPPDLVARAEEGVGAVTATERPRNYYPDVKVTEPWKLQERTIAVAPEPPVIADQPVRVLRADETERWIEIRDTTGRVITALELLSPSNKSRDGFDDYQRKRRGFMVNGVNLVEIDLVRQGTSVFSPGVRQTLKEAGATYGICVFRAAEPDMDEVYPARLRDRLPVIRVPLRKTDPDVILNLQPLINQCHERGRYHMQDYRTDPDPPFSPEDSTWIDRVLREAALRG